MGKPKYTPETITIESKKLKEIYRELCTVTQMEVRYDEDQLQMANCIIRQMKDKSSNICTELWNILNPYDKDDGSSGLK